VRKVKPTQKLQNNGEPPALGERRARWGFGYQDKVATERLLKVLTEELKNHSSVFEGICLADLHAGRVDDFVLIWGDQVEGNSIKWSGDAKPLNWGELIGTNGLVKELADGFQSLKSRWPERAVVVHLQSNRPPSTQIHHRQVISSQSVALFLRDHWKNGPCAGDSEAVREAWAKIQNCAGLDDDSFRSFVQTCRFSLGHPEPSMAGPDTRDWHHYVKQFDSLHKAIATWITNHPDRDRIDREYLLQAIGFRGYRTGLIQRFPTPEIPYAQNSDATQDLKKLIEDTSAGYLAVVGPAGAGKSTLVQDILGGPDYPFFIPYYAFLPDDPGTTRDRSEALTFFQDVVSRLEKLFAQRYSLGIADIPEGREALRHQMAEANKQYVIQGRKTVLLIDGIDHVAREIGLQSSVLNELPDPADIPEGFIIVLGSQPQGLVAGTVPPNVAYAVSAGKGRRIEVDGLARADVFAITTKFEKPTSSEEREELYKSSQGNPLILTYLLNLYRSTHTISVAECIDQLGTYAGDVDKYYAGRLATLLANASHRELLGLLCRAAPTIPTAWLRSWPEKVEIENLYAGALAPFMKEEDGNLQFIHNSLVSFLKVETRSKLPAADHVIEEQEFHSRLADRCDARSLSEPLGRARILHLNKAARYEDLLGVLTSAWLRDGSSAFLPYALVRPMIIAGLESAWKLGSLGEVLRLTLVDFEIDQRSSRTEPGDLADRLLKLDLPELAILQVRAAGRILVSDKTALKFCKDLWFYGASKGSVELQRLAKVLYKQSKPIALVYQGEAIDTLQHHDFYEILREWSEAAPLFEPLEDIIAQISALRFKVPAIDEEGNEASVKSGLYYGALLTLLKAGAEFERCYKFISKIRALGDGLWISAALLNCISASEGKITEQELEFQMSTVENRDFMLAYAEYLFSVERHNEASKVIASLCHHHIEPNQTGRSLGFTEVTFTATLRYFQERYGLDPGPISGVKDDYEESLARVEWAARELGTLRAKANLKNNGIDLTSAFRSVVLFENHTVVLSLLSGRKRYFVGNFKTEILEELVSVAHDFGEEGLEVLKNVVFDLERHTNPRIFYAHHRRQLASALFTAGVLDQEQSVRLGLSDTSDAGDDDPGQRQEACFEIATFLHAIGAVNLSREWVDRASVVAAGAGSHKDYHMSYLISWLAASVGACWTPYKLSVVEKFARSLQIAGGAGQYEAAKQLLALVMKFSAGNARHLAVEFLDREVMNLSSVIEGLILAGSNAGSSYSMLSSMYKELASLLDPGSTATAAVSVLRRTEQTRRVHAASDLMASVRTNTLPSHRLEVARALEDVLIEDGISGTVDRDGLKPSRDDSSYVSSLYHLATGETRTVDEMAQLLSRSLHPTEWNLNPSENGQFDWWLAIKRVNIQSKEHLDVILARFPYPEYREVEVLVWKSSVFLEFGDRVTAKKLAEEAISEARDASWFREYDGAKKMIAFGALKKIAHDEAVSRARTQFGLDLVHGRLHSQDLITNIDVILDFLELAWPADAALQGLEEYFDQVIAANETVATYSSILGENSTDNVDQGLAEFLVYLLAFPVVEIGVASRRALARYVASTGNAEVVWRAAEAVADSVQFENALIALHLAAELEPSSVKGVESEFRACNRHESVAVRSVAKRVCKVLGWEWKEIKDETPQLQILLPHAVLTDFSYADAVKLVAGGPTIAAKLFERVFAGLSDGNSEDAQSEFRRLYERIEQDYHWRDTMRLKRWMKLALAKFCLNQRAIIGREAAMRLLGRRALTGQAKNGAEEAYDFLYPVYDPVLELATPMERPSEMRALDWDLWDKPGEEWLKGEGAANWDSYPERIRTDQIIAELSFLIRPDRDWPREERYRGLTTAPIGTGQSRRTLASRHELVHADYLRGLDQGHNQLTLWNDENQLIGFQYRWVAFNSEKARELGWTPSPQEPFTWCDSVGNTMVRSIYWKDGWVSLEPPRQESLGEGWILLASKTALEEIRAKYPEAQMQLWVERHSHGDSKYKKEWHLQKAVLG